MGTRKSPLDAAPEALGPRIVEVHGDRWGKKPTGQPFTIKN